MTQEQFDEIVHFLEGAYGSELGGKQRDAWWLLLRDEDGGQILRAAVEHARSERARYGMPKPGELIRGHSVQARALLALDTAVRAADAWETVEFEDGTIHHVIHSLGGWSRWCEIVRWMPEHDFSFIKRDFERVYCAFAAQRPKEIPRLIGEFEKHNSQHEEWKKHTPPPALIACEYSPSDRNMRALPEPEEKLLDE